MTDSRLHSPDVAALQFLNLLDHPTWRANPAVQRALFAIGGAGQDIRQWRALLGSRDPAVREDSVRRLLNLREQVIRRLLIHLRSEPGAPTQVIREFWEMFTGLVPDQDMQIGTEQAVEALIELGAAAVPGLLEVMRLSSEERQRLAVQALGRIGAAASLAVPDLLLTLDNPNEALWTEAKKALRKIGPPALPGLIAVLGHSNPQVRSITAELAGPLAAAQIDSSLRRKAIDGLLHGLYDQAAEVRQASALSLGQIGQAHPQTIVRIASSLLPLLADRNDGARRAVEIAFEMMGNPIVPILAGALSSSKAEIRRSARRVLEHIDSDEARSALKSES